MKEHKLLDTAKINPDDYSLLTSANRWVSLGYAVSGCLYMLRWQKNTRILSVVTIAVIIMGLWLQVDLLSWAVLILTMAVVWMAEFLNAAIEAVVNLVTAEYHPMAKVAKDVAAGAVLLGAGASVLIGMAIFLPPLLEKFNL
jgi:diacylglycerol kinase (ATP)